MQDSLFRAILRAPEREDETIRLPFVRQDKDDKTKNQNLWQEPDNGKRAAILLDHLSIYSTRNHIIVHFPRCQIKAVKNPEPNATAGTKYGCFQ